MTCRVYWGSHGCTLERNHKGAHVCEPGCPPLSDYATPFGEDWYW